MDEADVDDDVDVDAVDAVARVIPRDEPMRGDRARRCVAVGDGDDDAFWLAGSAGRDRRMNARDEEGRRRRVDGCSRRRGARALQEIVVVEFVVERDGCGVEVVLVVADVRGRRLERVVVGGTLFQ